MAHRHPSGFRVHFQKIVGPVGPAGGHRTSLLNAVLGKRPGIGFAFAPNGSAISILTPRAVAGPNPSISCRPSQPRYRHLFLYASTNEMGWNRFDGRHPPTYYLTFWTLGHLDANLDGTGFIAREQGIGTIVFGSSKDLLVQCSIRCPELRECKISVAKHALQS